MRMGKTGSARATQVSPSAPGAGPCGCTEGGREPQPDGLESTHVGDGGRTALGPEALVHPARAEAQRSQWRISKQGSHKTYISVRDLVTTVPQRDCLNPASESTELSGKA